MIFLNHNVPKIDLHGLDSSIARVLVTDFIKENLILGNKEVMIIHGIGMGILRKTVHQVLNQYKDICEFSTDNFNFGVTLVKFKNK